MHVCARAKTYSVMEVWELLIIAREYRKLYELWKKSFSKFVSMDCIILMLLNIAIGFIGKLTKCTESR